MKKLISLAIALVLVLALLPTAAFAVGPDCVSVNYSGDETCYDPCCNDEALEAWFGVYKGETASLWAQDSIKEAIRKDYMFKWDVSGDSVFNYKSNIKRQEFMVMVIGWVTVETGTSIGPLIESAIAPEVLAGDITPIVLHANKYSPYMLVSQWLGVSDGTNYEGLLTREQAATLVMRAINLVNIIESTDGPLYNVKDLQAKVQATIDAPKADFVDMNQVSSWAVGGVSYCKANKIINGVGGNVFNPKGNLTVEQAIVMLMNIK